MVTAVVRGRDGLAAWTPRSMVTHARRAFAPPYIPALPPPLPTAPCVSRFEWGTARRTMAVSKPPNVLQVLARGAQVFFPLIVVTADVTAAAAAGRTADVGEANAADSETRGAGGYVPAGGNVAGSERK